MLLSPDKSQSITFHRKNKKKFPPMKFSINTTLIQESSCVKYLGLIMDQQLNYKEHVNYVYRKAAKNLGYLKYLCSFKGVKPSLSVYNLLYKTIIRPTLEYACPFWNGAADTNKKKLESIQ